MAYIVIPRIYTIVNHGWHFSTILGRLRVRSKNGVWPKSANSNRSTGRNFDRNTTIRRKYTDARLLPQRTPQQTRATTIRGIGILFLPTNFRLMWPLNLYQELPKIAVIPTL